MARALITARPRAVAMPPRAVEHGFSAAGCEERKRGAREQAKEVSPLHAVNELWHETLRAIEKAAVTFATRDGERGERAFEAAQSAQARRRGRSKRAVRGGDAGRSSSRHSPRCIPSLPRSRSRSS